MEEQLKGECGGCGRNGIWRDVSGGRPGAREDLKGKRKNEAQAMKLAQRNK